MKKYNFDVVVIGGGLAGVWTHSLLKKAGYSCCLLEKKSIGGEQSLLSQGIIHKGMKYLLGKFLPDIAGNLWQTAELWDAALSGKGELNLSETEIYTEKQLIWQSQGFLASFFTKGSQKIFQSQVQKLAPLELPFWLDKQKTAFWVKEKVINSHSLFQNFYSQQKEDYYGIDALKKIQIFNNSISLELGGVLLEAQKIILAAGRGNIALAEKLNIKQKIQLRPLKMLAVKFTPAKQRVGGVKNSTNAENFKIYGHCIGQSAKPLFSISTHSRKSHYGKNSELVYYLGGKIAEDGVGGSNEMLVAKAKELVAKNTKLKLEEAEWRCIKVDRAEPEQKKGGLPDAAFAECFDKAVLCFPVKLALVPQMALAIKNLLKKEKILPLYPQKKIQELPQAKLGGAFWETLF